TLANDPNRLRCRRPGAAARRQASLTRTDATRYSIDIEGRRNLTVPISPARFAMTPRVLAAELIRLVNERDADAAEALFAPSAELLFPRFAPRTVYRGGRELREFFSWLGEVLPQQVFA